MFSFKNCLKKRKDFQEVFKRGKSFKKDFLSIKILFKKQNYSQFGIIISKKVSNKASERNLIKRRIRAAVKEFLLEIKAPLDIVIIGQSKLNKQVSFQALKEELKQLFIKAKIIDNFYKNKK